MDPAPIWTDLKTFPWTEFCDRVDILTGGYPCQPFSSAGKRAGKDDPRHLWPWIADGIASMRPSVCFFENVEGHISLGLSDVIENLAGMGYRTTWGIFSASEVGAPHQRKRVFILAYRDDCGSWKNFKPQELRSDRLEQSPCDPRGIESREIKQRHSWSEEAMAYRSGEGLPRHRRLEQVGLSEGWKAEERCAATSGQLGSTWVLWPARPGEQQYAWEPPRTVENTIRSGGEEPSVQSADLSPESSGCDTEKVGNSNSINGSASPEGRVNDPQAGHASEAVMADTIGGWGQQSGSQCGSGEVAADGGCKEGAGDQQAAITDDQGSNGVIRQTQPALGGDPDGIAGGLDYAKLCVSCDNRTDELRLLGNGVVPATAELAFKTLWNELNKI